MQIAVSPWELELCDANSAALTDRVVSIRPDHGGRLVRLTRFSVQTGPESNGQPAIVEGQPVGLRVAPGDVRVIANADADASV